MGSGTHCQCSRVLQSPKVRLGRLIPGQVMPVLPLGFNSCKGQFGVPSGAVGRMDGSRDGACPSQEVKEGQRESLLCFCFWIEADYCCEFLVQK